MSAGSGTDLDGYGMGATAADFDRDGDTDLFVTRLGRPNVLLANDGTGHFEDVTSAAGVGHSGWGTSAAFFDADGNGWLDLYVCNYLDWAPELEHSCYGPAGVRDYCNPLTYPPQADLLYRNRGDGTFEDVSDTSGIGAIARDGLAVLATDLDGDGHVDLYVANDQMPAFFWRNKGDGTYVEDAMLAGCAFNEHGIAIAGMGLAAEDLDDDGDYDLIVTNILGQTHLGFRNEGGHFRDASRAWGLHDWSVPYTGWSPALFDQDHDGDLDLFVANGHVNREQQGVRRDDPFAQLNQFARRDGDEVFAAMPLGESGDDARVSRGALQGDLDGDGDLDLVITNNGGPTQLLRNDANSDNHWALLDVRDGDGVHAIGARLELTAGGHTWRREVRPNVGYLGSNDPRVHVGFGNAARIESLVIHWPDGATDELADLPTDRVLTVTRGEPTTVDVSEP